MGDDDTKRVSPAQCRGARAMLNWSQTDLEIKSGIARKTLADFEGNKRTLRSGTLAKIRAAFEEGGVEFLGHTGVRLRDR